MLNRKARGLTADAKQKNLARAGDGARKTWNGAAVLTNPDR